MNNLAGNALVGDVMVELSQTGGDAANLCSTMLPLDGAAAVIRSLYSCVTASREPAVRAAARRAHSRRSSRPGQ